MIDGETQCNLQDAQLGRCVRCCNETYGTNGYTMSLVKDEGLLGGLPREMHDNGQHRPQLNQLVASVGERRFDMVVVSTLDRLSRSVQLSQKLIEEVLKPHGVRLQPALRLQFPPMPPVCLAGWPKVQHCSDCRGSGVFGAAAVRHVDA
ncbi:MAG: recombinase family protein [Armatimonadia bacterium]